MTRHLEERDLRSLERPGLYKIFAPLDPDERLPRELVLEGRRYRWIRGRQLLGALWPLAFVAILGLGDQLNGLMLVALLAAAFAAFWVLTSPEKRH